MSDSALEAFRAETRAWLEANCPPEMREPVRDEDDVYWGGRNATFKNDAQKAWFEVCRDKGYTVPAWPKDYGGAGLSPAEAKVLREEMTRIGARPPLSSFGIWMLGPALLHFGTEGQKQRFLNEIARGEIRWCQGYSEPGSGSDLVSLQTYGEDKGDHWVVNGQKVWTSYADKADWIFCLVRTDKDNKYQGITFMLYDMASAGVSTKPILLISGNSPFCETFFDDVKVPAGNLIGAENDGLRQVFMGLNPERIMGAALGNGIGRYALDKASAYARERKVWDVPIGSHQGVSHPLAHAKIQVELARLMTQRAASLHDAGDPGSGEASNKAKYAAAEAGILALDQAIQTHGGNGMATEYGLATLWGPARLMRTAPISREMILNYVAQHSLKLPRSY